MFCRAWKMAMVACLFAVVAECQADAAKRAPQPIPPLNSERAASKHASASGASQSRSSSGSASNSPAGNWGTALGGLTAVVALIFLTAKVLRKSLPAAQRTLPIEVVQILGRKPLDYRHTIHLIRCGSRLLMVGASQDGLTTLCEMTDPVEIDYLAGLCKPNEATSVADSFNQLFRRFQSPAAAQPAVADEIQSGSDPAALRLHERLLNSRHSESDNLNGNRQGVDLQGESAA